MRRNGLDQEGGEQKKASDFRASPSIQIFLSSCIAWNLAFKGVIYPHRRCFQRVSKAFCSVASAFGLISLFCIRARV
jgi:hypothetical protein